MEQLLAGTWMYNVHVCTMSMYVYYGSLVFILSCIYVLCCVYKKNSCVHLLLCADPNQIVAMQGMGDEEAMMNLAIALSLNEVC